MNFSKWLDTFISEKGIDINQTFEFTDSKGWNNYMPYGVVVEAIHNAPEHEKRGIKDMLIRLDFCNLPILPYLQHLGRAMVENLPREDK